MDLSIPRMRAEAHPYITLINQIVVDGFYKKCHSERSVTQGDLTQGDGSLVSWIKPIFTSFLQRRLAKADRFFMRFEKILKNIKK